MGTSHKSLYVALQESCQQWAISPNEDGGIAGKALFSFREEFPGFAGHFPEAPILPAIVQLASVRFLAECCLKEKVTPINYGHTKFRGMIQPNEIIEVTIDLQEDNDEWAGKFSLQKIGEGVVSTGQCRFSIVKEELQS